MYAFNQKNNGVEKVFSQSNLSGGKMQTDALFKRLEERLSNSQVGKYLDDIKFSGFESNINEILNDIKHCVKNCYAGIKKRNGLGFEPSYLYTDEKQNQLSKDQHISSFKIAIDVGGTNTKVVVKDGDKTTLLFEKSNEDFMYGIDMNKAKEQKNGDALKGFIKNLLSEIKIELDEKNIGEDKKIKGIAVVWSNAIESSVATAQVKGYDGIRAVVIGIDDGRYYKKGEPFIVGLYDGFDISESFSDAANSVFGDRFLNHFIIANDTVFSLKALPGASSGIVMSTGANFTLVDNKGIIYNTEGPASYHLNDDYVTKNEAKFKEECEDEKLVPIQAICSGKWLGKIMEEYILDMAEKSVGNFKNLAQDIKDYYKEIRKPDDCFIDSKHITGAYSDFIGKPDLDSKFSKLISKYPGVKEDFELLASSLIKRAIYCCSLFCVASCEEENGEYKKEKTVALDSTIIRYSKSIETLNKIVNKLSDGKISVKLVEQISDKDSDKDGESISVPLRISVPLQGALATL